MNGSAGSEPICISDSEEAASSRKSTGRVCSTSGESGEQRPHAKERQVREQRLRSTSGIFDDESQGQTQESQSQGSEFSTRTPATVTGTKPRLCRGESGISTAGLSVGGRSQGSCHRHLLH